MNPITKSLIAYLETLPIDRASWIKNAPIMFSHSNAKNAVSITNAIKRVVHFKTNPDGVMDDAFSSVEFVVKCIECAFDHVEWNIVIEWFKQHE